MKTNRLQIYSLVAYLLLILLLSLLVIGAASANDEAGYLGVVNVMETDESGLESPAGFVFSSRANGFHVVESRGIGSDLSDASIIKDISVFGHEVGSTTINFVIENPINMAMDNQLGRLLIYQSTTQQLIEVYEDSDGNLDPNTLAIYDASSLGLLDPQGMAFDSIQGNLFFIDTVGPRLVRVTLQPDGSVIGAAIDGVNLLWAGNTGLRGIAYDSVSGNFHAVSLNEQKLYEFNNIGEMIAFRDLSGFNLSNTQSIVFAPSTDQTDDPMELSLFLADSRVPSNPGNDLLSNDNSLATSSVGKITEFSLVQPLNQINANFTSVLVKTTNTSAFSKPSPDPAGLTYVSSSDRLIITDCDVEEIKGGFTRFAGVNLWETTRGGTVQRTANISLVPYITPSLVPMTNEPTGIAWNPGNGHYYFTDDNTQKIFDLNPGIDGLTGTADDGWTSFSTTLENGDPEGIVYDSWQDRLFVIDGTNLEVYVYSLSGSFINQFDVAGLGAIDTESIEFNPNTGTFFILSNLGVKKIFEVSVDTSPVFPILWTATELNTIDITAIPSLNASGLGYAPASIGSGLHFYVTDRGIDNLADPYQNDGKLFEMTAPSPDTPPSTPPIVNAGSNQTIYIGATANLDGTVSDDGLPNPPGVLTTLWTKTSGPGNVTFGDPNAVDTTASFSATGSYALRLTASDSLYSTYDELSVYVTQSADSDKILEVRLVSSSDDAEESNTGAVDLVSPSLGMTWPDKTIGMRFIGINLPKNAIIHNAYIQFQTQKINDVTTSLTIWGEAQDNPGTFTVTSLDLSSRLRTASSMPWSPPAWNSLYEEGVKQRTSNITPILHELIDRPGWTDGNSMVFIVRGTGLRTAWSFDGLRSGAPRLHVEYTISDNHAPVAVPDNYTTPEDTQLSKTANQGVLKNDTDADNDDLTAFKMTEPSHGTLIEFNDDGSFTYMPALNYNGPDSFTYYVNDGEFNSNIATVTINVTPVNDAPVANNQSVTTDEDTPKGITLTASDVDVDPLSWIIVAQPTHGTLSGTAPTLTYTPALNYNGDDIFTFKVNDGHVDSNVATVSISIGPVLDWYYLPMLSR